MVDWIKTALGGLEVGKTISTYGANKRAGDARVKYAQAEMERQAQQDAYDAQYESGVNAYNAASRAAAAAARSATDKNRRAATQKALKKYGLDVGKLREMYDPYIQMLGRVTPKMEQSYSKGVSDMLGYQDALKANLAKRSEANSQVPESQIPDWFKR